MSLLALTKKRDDALAAVASATTPDGRSTALAALEKASLKLASFQAKIEGKSKTFVKKEERYEEEESASAEEGESASASASAEEAASPKKKPMSKKSKSKKSEDESGSESDSASGSAEEADSSDSSSSSSDSGSSGVAEESAEDESAEEESAEENAKKARSEAKKAHSILSSNAGVYTYAKLYALAQRITGKHGVHEVFGALDAIGVRLQAAEKVEKRVERIEVRHRREKVDGMLMKARREGKITRDAVESLRTKGMSDPRWLKAHLGALPKRVRTLDEAALEGVTIGGSSEGDERRGKHLDAQSLSPDQRKIVESMASGTGKSVDEFMGDVTKRLNGSTKK